MAFGDDHDEDALFFFRFASFFVCVVCLFERHTDIPMIFIWRSFSVVLMGTRECVCVLHHKIYHHHLAQPYNLHKSWYIFVLYNNGCNELNKAKCAHFFAYFLIIISSKGFSTVATYFVCVCVCKTNVWEGRWISYLIIAKQVVFFEHQFRIFFSWSSWSYLSRVI